MGGWSTLNLTTEGGKLQAFGHMAEHRCTKDAAEERAGLKPGPYKGEFWLGAAIR